MKAFNTALRTTLQIFLLWLFVLGCGTSNPKPLRLGELYWLLDRACWYGDEHSVEILLKAGADPSGPRGYADFHKTDHIGLEPTWHLCQAAYAGQAGVTRLLLNAGADPNLEYGEGVTALTIAVDKGDIEVVSLLINAGANKDYKSVNGTAAQIAERRGRKDILNLLLGAK